MKALRSVVLLVSVFCFAPQLRAQFVWSIVHDYKDDTVANYTPLLLDCSGEHCTAVLEIGLVSFIFLRSDDGGLSWRQQWWLPAPAGPVYQGFRYVYAIQQIDSANCVVVGDSSHIFRTFDAGETWTKQLPPAGWENASMEGVHFHDPMNGIIGLGDRPMTTSDGGQHWTLGPIIGKPGDQNCHCFGPGRFGIFSHNNKVYHTSDSWATYDSTGAISDTSMLPTTLPRCRWTDGDTVLAYGERFTAGGPEAMIIRSSDGGKSWSKAHIPSQIRSSNPEILSMSNITDDTVYAGGGYPGTIMVSTDNGQTWRFDTVVISGELTAIQTETSIARPEPGIVLASMIYIPTLNSPGIIARRIPASMDVNVSTNKSDVFLYPNPASNSILVTGLNSELWVLDALGRAYAVPNHDGTLDVSQLPAGVYYVLLKGGTEAARHARFVKE
jgi:photosystem II stability/assembly factor-like uncharacterized protein